MTVKQSVSGFVQAGGKSLRMGQNKALLKLGEIKLIEYSIKALSSVVSEVGIITNTPELYKDFGVLCYRDVWPNLGPMAGIYAALKYSNSDYVVTIACDMPFVSTELLKILFEHKEDYQICVPLDFNGELQPLCAIYHKSCQNKILSLIENSKYAPRELFSLVKTRIIPFEKFSHLNFARHFFENINSPKDFEFASKLLGLK